MAEQVQSGPEQSRGVPVFRRGVSEPLDGEDRSEIMGHGGRKEPLSADSRTCLSKLYGWNIRKTFTYA
jgi:hypothetical protein